MALGGASFQVEVFQITARTSAQARATTEPGRRTWTHHADQRTAHRESRDPQSTVTPEPISMMLLGTGLAGVGVARRRKKNWTRNLPSCGQPRGVDYQLQLGAFSCAMLPERLELASTVTAATCQPPGRERCRTPWSRKDERKYEHIRESAEQRGMSASGAPRK